MKIHSLRSSCPIFSILMIFLIPRLPISSIDSDDLSGRPFNSKIELSLSEFITSLLIMETPVVGGGR